MKMYYWLIVLGLGFVSSVGANEHPQGTLSCEVKVYLGDEILGWWTLPEKKISIKITKEADSFDVVNYFTNSDFESSPEFGGVIAVRVSGDFIHNLRGDPITLSISHISKTQKSSKSPKAFSSAYAISPLTNSLSVYIESRSKGIRLAGAICEFTEDVAE